MCCVQVRLKADSCSGSGSGELWLGGLWDLWSEVIPTALARLLAMRSMLFEILWSYKTGTLAIGNVAGILIL